MFSSLHHAVSKQARNTKSRPQMNSDLVSCATEMLSGGPLHSACLMRAADKLNLSAYWGMEQEVGRMGAGGLDKEISYWGLFSVGFKRIWLAAEGCNWVQSSQQQQWAFSLLMLY